MTDADKRGVIEKFQAKYKGRIREGLLELSEEEFDQLISCTDNITAKIQWSNIRREGLAQSRVSSQETVDRPIDDMIAELEEYYECAGFADFYERVLSKMDEAQIRKYYHDTFESGEDLELEEWERTYKCEK